MATSITRYEQVQPGDTFTVDEHGHVHVHREEPVEPTFTPHLPSQLTELFPDGSYLAETMQGVVLRYKHLPDILLSHNATILQLLNNEDIRRLGLRVPLRERLGPYEPYPADWPKKRA